MNSFTIGSLVTPQSRSRRRFRMAAAGCLLSFLMPMLTGCDDDDFGSSEIIDIIYAAADVVLAILRTVL